MAARSVGGPFIVDPDRYGHCVFTTEEAPGAIPNGYIVRKSDSEAGDSTPTGALGEVIGSVPADKPSDDVLARLPRRYRDVKVAYFIQWQERPNEVLGIIDAKIEEV